MPYKDPERQRQFQREQVAKRRRDWLRDKVCARCGGSQELEVDHVDRALKVSHKVWSWSLERMEAELRKCQVLCRSCHQKKTSAEVEPPHGTNSRYTGSSWKCRCDACRRAHRETNALYR